LVLLLDKQTTEGEMAEGDAYAGGRDAQPAGSNAGGVVDLTQLNKGVVVRRCSSPRRHLECIRRHDAQEGLDQELLNVSAARNDLWL
jgi:hypothetical protein